MLRGGSGSTIRIEFNCLNVPTSLTDVLKRSGKKGAVIVSAVYSNSYPICGLYEKTRGVSPFFCDRINCPKISERLILPQALSQP